MVRLYPVGLPAARGVGRANFAAPFSGYLSKWEFTVSQLQASGWWGSLARFNLAALVGLTVQTGYLLWRREWGSAWWRVGVLYSLLMLVLSYPIWEGDPGAIVRVVLPVSVAFNVLVSAAAGSGRSSILGNLSVCHGLPMIGVPWLAATSLSAEAREAAGARRTVSQ